MRLSSAGVLLALALLTGCGTAPAAGGLRAAAPPRSVATRASARPSVPPGGGPVLAHAPGPAALQALRLTVTHVSRVSLPATVPLPAGGVPLVLTVTVTNPTSQTLYLDTLDLGAGATSAAGATGLSHAPIGAVYCSADYIDNATWRPPSPSLFPLPAGSQSLLPLQYPMNGYLLSVPGGAHRRGTLTIVASRQRANALWVMDNCGPVATPLVTAPFTLP